MKKIIINVKTSALLHKDFDDVSLSHIPKATTCMCLSQTLVCKTGTESERGSVTWRLTSGFPPLITH